MDRLWPASLGQSGFCVALFPFSASTSCVVWLGSRPELRFSGDGVRSMTLLVFEDGLMADFNDLVGVVGCLFSLLTMRIACNISFSIHGCLS